MFFFLSLTVAAPKCLLAQDEHTFVEKGLAIETSGSMGVFNEDYKNKIGTLNDLVSFATESTEFKDTISKYKTGPSRQAALDVLDAIHKNVFTKNKGVFAFVENPYTLSQALTLNTFTNKLTFDCDTSSFIYLEIFERISTALPVVLLVCPDHALIRWKFVDGSYVNWETTAGVESPEETNKKYIEEGCKEVISGSDAFYALFYFNSGSTKLAKGDAEGAITDYGKAVELDPKNTDVYNNLGSAKTTLQDYVGAITSYNKAIELNPKDPVTYYNRGTAKCVLKDYAGGIADFDKAVELNPKYETAYLNRGTAKSLLEDYVGGIADFDKVLELDPKSESANTYRELAKKQIKNNSYNGILGTKLYSAGKLYSIKVRLDKDKKIGSVGDITLGSEFYDHDSAVKVKTLNVDGTFVIVYDNLNYKIIPDLTKLSFDIEEIGK